MACATTRDSLKHCYIIMLAKLIRKHVFYERLAFLTKISRERGTCPATGIIILSL